MKRGPTLFLQAVIILIAIGMLTFLLWEPWREGVNANADFAHVYFDDPFLAYVYFASIFFFVALYKAFRVLGYARHNQVFTETAISALATIKLCSLAIVGFVIGAEIWLMTQFSDDRAGGIAMGIFVTFGSLIMATGAAMFEQILRNAVAIKSENDLTV